MTKFFRHYKNKPYKLIGIAKHSETLEELVVYETLYRNELGNLWVRPKAMFYENVRIENQSVRRFAPVEFDIRAFVNPRHNEYETIFPLIEKTFENFSKSKFEAVLANHSQFFLQTAYEGSRLAGFKLGYQIDSDKFYSWLGAVDPNYQRLGLATTLIHHQHDWCRTRGIQSIQTKTKNRWRGMLILNLHCGFDIIGSYTDKLGDTKLILEKNLNLETKG